MVGQMTCQVSLFLLCIFGLEYALASTTSYNVTTEPVESNNTALESKNVSEIIKKKLERLRSLQAEMKSLKQELRESNVGGRIPGIELTNVAEKSSKKDRRLKRWKKRIQKSIGRLTKRLTKLERAVTAQRESIKKVGDKTKSMKRKHKSSTTTTLSSPIQQQNTTTYTKSRPGEHKSPCTTHKDCSPGHCCHKSDESSNCVKHALNETDVCRDSCQCDSHLQCFRRKSNDVDDGKSYCKRAHSKDFSQGVYESTKDTFDN